MRQPSLDCGSLRERLLQWELTSPGGVPEVPALLLRLLSYSDVGTPSDERKLLMNWASSKFETWISLLGSDRSVTFESLASDPCNLILGAMALPDSADARRILSSYAEFCESLAGQNCYPFSFGNQHFATFLLQSAGVLRSDSILVKELSRPFELSHVSGNTLVHYALMSSSQAKPSCTTAVQLQQIIEAYAICSARRKDISNVALACVALAHNCQPIGSPIIDWLQSHVRTDGLVGVWDLYGGNDLIPPLLTTVNAHWALHACGSGAALPKSTAVWPVVPIPERSLIAVDTKVWKVTVLKMCLWLEERYEHFKLQGRISDQESLANRLKALAEVSLLLWVLNAKGSEETPEFLTTWSKRFAAKLWSEVEWEGFLEIFRTYPKTSLGLLAYAALSNLLDRRGRHHHEIEQILESEISRYQERTPMRMLDYCFLCRLMGAAQPYESADLLQFCLIGHWPDSPWLDTDSIYDLTHAVFYATDFGSADVAWPESIRRKLNDNAPLLLSTAVESDWDLASELLLMEWYAGVQPNEFHARALNGIISAAMTSGAVPGPPRAKTEDRDDFAFSYHTTLVALAALYEAWRYNLCNLRFATRHPLENNPKDDALRRVPMEELGIAGVEQVARIGKSGRLCISDSGELWVVNHWENGVSKELEEIIKHVISRGVFTEWRLSPDQKSKARYSARRFVPELTVIEKSKDLEESMHVLGSLAAKLHAGSKGPNLPQELWKRWRDRFERACSFAAVRPPLSWETFRSRAVLCHGDLHAGNALATKPPCLIDLGELIVAPAEFDLALALAYVNTSYDDFRRSYMSILRGYLSDGPMIDRELLHAFIPLAPHYMVAAQIESEEPHPGSIQSIKDIGTTQAATHAMWLNTVLNCSDLPTLCSEKRLAPA